MTDEKKDGTAPSSCPTPFEHAVFPSTAPAKFWQRCLDPLSSLRPLEVCDKPLTEWPDLSWRCPDGHYNSPSTLRREAAGRLVREVWVVWAADQDDPKPHHLAPWDELGEGDREVDRRIGETLLGIRDWRHGQRLDNAERRSARAVPTPSPEPLAGDPGKWPCKCGRQQKHCPCYMTGCEDGARHAVVPSSCKADEEWHRLARTPVSDDVILSLKAPVPDVVDPDDGRMLLKLRWLRDTVGVDIERMFARAQKEKDGRQ